MASYPNDRRIAARWSWRNVTASHSPCTSAGSSPHQSVLQRGGSWTHSTYNIPVVRSGEGRHPSVQNPAEPGSIHTQSCLASSDLRPGEAVAGPCVMATRRPRLGDPASQAGFTGIAAFRGRTAMKILRFVFVL